MFGVTHGVTDFDGISCGQRLLLFHKAFDILILAMVTMKQHIDKSIH